MGLVEVWVVVAVPVAVVVAASYFVVENIEADSVARIVVGN